MSNSSLALSAFRRFFRSGTRLSPTRMGRIAYRLLAKPRRPKPTPSGKLFLEQAQLTYHTIDGQRIATYYWPADGPEVLLLHGWESCSARWSPYYDALREAGYAIRAIDAPGQGRSSGREFSAMAYAGVMKGYFEELGGAPPFWVGHSAGGMASIYYLTKLQGRYQPEKLVLMAVAAELADITRSFSHILGLDRRVYQAMEHEFVRRHGVRFEDFSFKSMAKELDVAGLIIHDRADELAPYAGAQAIHANWADSEMISTEGRTHSILGADIPRMLVDYLKK